MPRLSDPAIRNDLCDRAVDYVIEHGLADLSLRPLAEGIGTSARMLVYHFGSRDGLMKAILERLREREDKVIDAWFRSRRRPPTIREFVRWYWRRLSSRAARSATLLIFEVYVLALRNPADYPGVLQDPLDYWRKLLDRGGRVPKRDAETSATLLLAGTRGLLLDFAASGDQGRINRALTKLLRILPG